MLYVRELRKRCVFYGKNTTLHGLKYVADDDRHFLIRLMWIGIFVLNFWAMLVLFGASYKSYQENAISFVTETAYLNWNTTFPAITLCEIAGAGFVWNDEFEISGEDANAVQLFVSDLMFFTGSCYSCNTPCPSCEKLNFTGIVENFRKSCRQLLTTCKWNEEEFQCCDHFLPLQTEYGVCFSLNSLHTTRTISQDNSRKMSLVSNRKSGPGRLIIQSIEDVRMYFHAPEDVPFINSDPDQRKDVMLGETCNISLNIIEIENDDNVKNLDVESRNCRFPWEVPDSLKVHKYYSYSSCVVQCHADNHRELCNCTHHLMPVYNLESYCDVEGLQCLTDNFETVNRLHAKGFDKPGLVCDCLPSCVEPEYKVVADTKGVKNGHSEIEIRMQSLPTSRFKRIVVRTTMDLVVSVGGTAGLFIGASLLSIVDTIYLFFMRKVK